MLLYFQTLSTLYLEANHKVPTSRFKVLSMSESDFSELVYSEVRRGIRPSMYALSTVIFVVVLVVLLIANFRKQPEKD